MIFFVNNESIFSYLTVFGLHALGIMLH